MQSNTVAQRAPETAARLQQRASLTIMVGGEQAAFDRVACGHRSNSGWR
ncbi:MAG: hypothetical protein I4O48_07460, partial [Ralstonia sp.]|nr:hypothetical protein [Ralstonia sp.]